MLLMKGAIRLHGRLTHSAISPDGAFNTILGKGEAKLGFETRGSPYWAMRKHFYLRSYH